MSSENLSQEEIDELFKRAMSGTKAGGSQTGQPNRPEPTDEALPESQVETGLSMSQSDAVRGGHSDGAVRPSNKSPEVRRAVFERLDAGSENPVPISGMDMLLDVPLTVSVELGRARCYVKDLLNLTVGSVVELDRLAGDSVDILVNGRLFARGEVVVIDENFGVRIQEIVSRKTEKASRRIQ